MDSFQGLTTKSPSSWHRPLAPNPIFYDHVNPVIRLTIPLDKSAVGNFMTITTEAFLGIIEDLASMTMKVGTTQGISLRAGQAKQPCLKIPEYIATAVIIEVLKIKSNAMMKFYSTQKHCSNRASDKKGGTQKERNQKLVKIDLPKISLSRIHKRTKQKSVISKTRKEVKGARTEENEMETNMKVDELIEEESEFETDEEVEEILKEEEDDLDGENFNLFPTMEELTHHEWLLKNPRPPWVKARIRAGSPNNIKISCMVGHLFKRHAYIDLESPINIILGVNIIRS
ncbi:hypothetical protein Tco_0803413 [Tanacetum coccineum]|uniref:Uncharacterized protein n=1 Tax=Tanacetum coccineum TaxID=301880 RepID=A0ABQ5A5P8_9ASTR